MACLDEAVHERVVGTVGDEEPELLEGDLRVLGTHQTRHVDGGARLRVRLRSQVDGVKVGKQVGGGEG